MGRYKPSLRKAEPSGKTPITAVQIRVTALFVLLIVYLSFAGVPRRRNWLGAAGTQKFLVLPREVRGRSIPAAGIKQAHQTVFINRVACLLWKMNFCLLAW